VFVQAPKASRMVTNKTEEEHDCMFDSCCSSDSTELPFNGEQTTQTATVIADVALLVWHTDIGY
jgi:hypothetical protein